MKWLKSAFNTLFGASSLNASQTFNTVAKGIDNLLHTDQERVTEWFEWYKTTLEENGVRSQARRVIAILIVVNTIISFWFCIIMAVLGKDIKTVFEIIGLFHMGEAFLLVLGFFFGGHYLRSFRKEKKS